MYINEFLNQLEMNRCTCKPYGFMIHNCSLHITKLFADFTPFEFALCLKKAYKCLILIFKYKTMVSSICTGNIFAKNKHSFLKWYTFANFQTHCAGGQKRMHDHLCIKELDCQQSNLVVALHHDQVTHTSGKNFVTLLFNNFNI